MGPPKSWPEQLADCRASVHQMLSCFMLDNNGHGRDKPAQVAHVEVPLCTVILVCMHISISLWISICINPMMSCPFTKLSVWNQIFNDGMRLTELLLCGQLTNYNIKWRTRPNKNSQPSHCTPTDHDQKPHALQIPARALAWIQCYSEG